jgi:ankyrin repeat protein
VNHVDNEGNTALIFAAALGRTDFVNVLLKVKANVNAACNKGRTPLISAARSSRGATVAINEDVFLRRAVQNRIEVVDLLILNRAILDHVDEEGNTALFHAVESDYPEVVDLLVLSGADVSGNISENDMVIRALQKKKKSEFFKFTDFSKTLPDSPSNYGQSALIDVAENYLRQ